MNTSNMDLNLFKVFNTIYLESSITKPAETLGIIQLAVSNSLSLQAEKPSCTGIKIPMAQRQISGYATKS